jgi:hypothetical protein
MDLAVGRYASPQQERSGDDPRKAENLTLKLSGGNAFGPGGAMWRVTGPIVLVLLSMGIVGCSAKNGGDHIVFVALPASRGVTGLPNLQRDGSRLQPGELSGCFVKDQLVYVVLAISPDPRFVPLANVTVAPGEEVAALQAVASAISLPCEIAPANPVTNSAGEVQVLISYHTGMAQRDLAATIKDTILDGKRKRK